MAGARGRCGAAAAAAVFAALCSAMMEPATAGCASAADCGYNGACTGGACRCEPPWTGPECQVLRLKDVAPGSGLREDATSTWGGSVLYGDDGRLYMYAAEMVAHCGIQAWTRNSRVIVASADNASAPFRFEKELFGVFSHEPAATRAPSGDFVIYFTTTTLGCGSYGKCVPDSICAGLGNSTTCNPGGPTCWTQCTDGSTPHTCHDNATEASPLTRFPTYMAWSKHPLGPFSTPVMVFNGSDQGGPQAPATGDTNFAGVIFDDGSLVGMWRGDRKSFSVKPNVVQYEYSVTASDWRNPASYRWGYALKSNNVFPQLVPGSETRTCGIEDPTLWLDRKKNVVHAVVHNWRAGGHAASADRGKTWRWYGGNCSADKGSGSIDWSRSVWPQSFTQGGQKQQPSRRERPHIVVDPNGTVTALTTAVQLHGDRTWTLVQETVTTPAKTDDDVPVDRESACSLNGILGVDGVCACDPGWSGSDCGALKLGPTATSAIGAGRIYPSPTSETSSWGGGVVQRDGRFHLYVSEMGHHCGLSTWGTNSFIRHAESDTIDGVYTPRETVLAAWSHNALPWVTPDGEISVWHIGDGTLRRPEKTGCTNGTTPIASAEGRHVSAGAEAPQPISQIPYSKEPAGPWKMKTISCTDSEGAAGPCPIDNPTPISLRNGTTLIAHRARGGFGLLVGPHWSGPFRNIAGLGLNATNIPAPADEFSCEDGFLFRGQRDGLHLLCHCNGVQGYPWDDHGRVAFSRDGINWRWSKERTFPPALSHPDGTNTSHISRQRPQLVFGPDMVPTHLITGVAVASTNRPYPWQETCGELDAVSKPCDLTCTAMQPILKTDDAQA